MVDSHCAALVEDAASGLRRAVALHIDISQHQTAPIHDPATFDGRMITEYRTALDGQGSIIEDAAAVTGSVVHDLTSV